MACNLLHGKASANAPIKFSELQRSAPGFENYENPLAHEHYQACNHDGECNSDNCGCFTDKTTCRSSCLCGSECPRQFPSCNHIGACTPSCFCVSSQRSCTDSCSCKDCPNDVHRAVLPATEIKESTYKNAGLGLFGVLDIVKGTLIGIYHGPLCSNASKNKPSKKRKYNKDGISAFEISKGMLPSNSRDHFVSLIIGEFIDGKDWCASYYVNHPNSKQDTNARFVYMETSTHREVCLFATKEIPNGTEILALYHE